MAKNILSVNPLVLGNHPFYLLNRIFVHRGREINRALSQHDLDYPKWRVLSVLDRCPGCTMQALADTAGVDRTTLTHTVQLLIDAGLITKTARETDRRSVVLSLTKRGAKKFKKAMPIIVALNKRSFSGLSSSELKSFVGTLKRIIANAGNGSVPRAMDSLMREEGVNPHTGNFQKAKRARA